MIATIPKMICYPPAPINGGPLGTAPRKVGNWVWQPKVDDWRAMVHTPTGTVWNQYGQLMSIRDKFHSALTHLQQISTAAAWLDCGMMNNRNDMMRGSIVVLDHVDRRPFQDRRAHLQILFDVLPWATALVGSDLAHDRVYLIPQFTGEEEGGLALYKSLQTENAQIGRKFYEGVVAKRLGTSYRFNQSPKVQTSDWIKHRFDQ